MVRFFARYFELNHMLHRLCGSPSIPLGFNLAVVLPRRVLNALAAALISYETNAALIVYGVVCISCLLTLSRLSVSYRPKAAFATGRFL